MNETRSETNSGLTRQRNVVIACRRRSHVVLPCLDLGELTFSATTTAAARHRRRWSWSGRAPWASTPRRSRSSAASRWTPCRRRSCRTTRPSPSSLSCWRPRKRRRTWSRRRRAARKWPPAPTSMAIWTSSSTTRPCGEKRPGRHVATLPQFRRRQRGRLELTLSLISLAYGYYRI